MSDSQEERIVALVDRWIIDYFSRSIWKHFEDYGTVANDWIDGFIQERQCIQVLETQPGENLDMLELRSRLLIQFMCRMSSGSLGTILINGDVDDGHTELEEAIDLLDQIIKIGNDDLTASDILRITVSVKQQAVYACCREGNFELAAKVFFRQWKSWKTKEEMEARRNIAEVLDSKNHVHEHLKLLTYEATINESKAFLKKLFSEMAPPFLTNAARNVWEHMKNEDDIIVKENEADLSEILNIKVEKGNSSGRFKVQQLCNDVMGKGKTLSRYDDLTEIADEVCAMGSRNLPITIPPMNGGSTSVLKQSGVAFAAGSNTSLTALPTIDAGNNGIPMIFWTNSIPPNVISATNSTNVRTSHGQQQGIPSYNFTQKTGVTSGGGERMYVQLPASASQFSSPRNVYLTTAPSFSGSAVVQSTPNQFSAHDSAPGLWNLPVCSTVAAGILPATTTATGGILLSSEKEIATVGKRKYKNKKKRRGRKNREVSREEITFEPIRSEVGSTKVAAVPPSLRPLPAPLPPPPAAEKKKRGRKPKKGFVDQAVNCSPVDNQVQFVAARAEPRKHSAPKTTVTVVDSKMGKKSKKEQEQELKHNVALSEDRIPVLCLTKISKETLQKLPTSPHSKIKITKKPKVMVTESTTSRRRDIETSDLIRETKQHSQNERHVGRGKRYDESKTNNKHQRHETPDDVIVTKSKAGTKRPISSSKSTERPPKKNKMTILEESPDQYSKEFSISPSRFNTGRWRIEEEEILYKGIQKYGVGHWALITKYCLPGRQASKISAKWNALSASRKVVALMKKFGPVP